MAASATTAAATAYNITTRSFSSTSSSTSKNCHYYYASVSCSFPHNIGATKHQPRRRRRVLFSIIKNSTNDVSASAETTTNAEPESSSSAEEEEEEANVEVSKGPPSIISALNVEKALRGIAITDIDYYGTLGLPRGCSYDQVTVAYSKKVEEMKNQGLDEEELNKQLELLKESYSILSSMEDRRLYDWSLARAENPDRYMWPFEVDKSKTSPESPPPQEPEDVGPTRVTGYIILGWLMLSFVLLVAFNR